jgi:hypothetical protein
LAVDYGQIVTRCEFILQNEDDAAQHDVVLLLAYASRIWAGGRPFRVFSIEVLSPLDDTTPVRQRRGTGLAFQGARPFALEGSGF